MANIGLSKSRIEPSLIFRPIHSKLIRSLRVTLQKIDEDFPSQADEPIVTTLKRLLHLRIAELESDGKNKLKATGEPEGLGKSNDKLVPTR
jgi:hypothetical protein